MRSLLHRAGLRFRLHDRGLQGSPDLVLRRHATVVFVHGCYWHRHEGCHLATTPSTNAEFWREKFRQNVERDLAARAALEAAGWRVVVIWECETRDPVRLAGRIAQLFPASNLGRISEPFAASAGS